MTKVAEKARITACKRILKNAKKYYSRFPQGAEHLKYMKYANTIDGIQYIIDGYRIATFKTPLPLEERPDDVKLTQNLYEHIQEKTSKSVKLNIPDKIALKAYIKAYKEEQKAIGIKYPTPPTYNFGKGLPIVNSEYLLDMLNIFPDGTFYANSMYNIFIEDSEGNKGNLLALRKLPTDENAEATKL